MNKTTVISIMIVIALVAGGGGFYGGMTYQKSKTPQGAAGGNLPDFANLTPEQRQQQFQQMGINGNGFPGGRFGGGAGGPGGGGFTAGEITAKDDKSISVKLQDGSSKIVLYSGSTTVSKNVTGSVDTDLSVGEQVTITGSANQDGSITANSIQLRPDVQGNSNTNSN